MATAREKAYEEIKEDQKSSLVYAIKRQYLEVEKIGVKLEDAQRELQRLSDLTPLEYWKENERRRTDGQVVGYNGSGVITSNQLSIG